MAKYNEYTKQIDLSEDDKNLFRENNSDIQTGRKPLPRLMEALDNNFVGYEMKEPNCIHNIKGECLEDKKRQDEDNANWYYEQEENDIRERPSIFK